MSETMACSADGIMKKTLFLRIGKGFVLIINSPASLARMGRLLPAN